MVKSLTMIKRNNLLLTVLLLLSLMVQFSSALRGSKTLEQLSLIHRRELKGSKSSDDDKKKQRNRDENNNDEDTREDALEEWYEEQEEQLDGLDEPMYDSEDLLIPDRDRNNKNKDKNGKGKGKGKGKSGKGKSKKKDKKKNQDTPAEDPNTSGHGAPDDSTVGKSTSMSLPLLVVLHVS